mmetsp:Transcript_40704/g.100106  ORF Transcript_40704/g.100106 Transcript_40704/m.100106 type:complete len:226 (-) Transcript_40704:61-738(-)
MRASRCRRRRLSCVRCRCRLSLRGLPLLLQLPRSMMSHQYVMFAAATTARAQPANDVCEGALELEGTGAFSVSSTGATTSTVPLSACDTIVNDVWFRWTATCNGVLILSTCDFGDHLDTELGVYSSCSGSLNELTPSCNNVGGCGNHERHSVKVELGKQYYFRVGMYRSGVKRSDFRQYHFAGQQLTAFCTQAVRNDECDGATALVGSSPFLVVIAIVVEVVAVV